jgi:serine/threonine protein phosphatase 1
MTYAIGDIHGCLVPLKTLMRKINPQPGDTLVFLGDYCDRGPDTYGVIEYLIGLRSSLPAIGIGVVFLRGNHEAMWLEALGPNPNSLSLWISNGGDITIRPYLEKGLPCPTEEHLHFLHQTQMFYETDTHFFVHAGLSPDLTIEQNKDYHHRDEIMLWSRGGGSDKWDKMVVVGHTPNRKVIRKQNKICIDTGCVFPHLGMGTLTAYNTTTDTIIQVSNRT